MIYLLFIGKDVKLKFRQFDKLTHDQYVYDIEADVCTEVYTENNEPIFVGDYIRIQGACPGFDLDIQGKVILREGQFCIDTGTDLVNIYQECAIITKLPFQK